MMTAVTEQKQHSLETLFAEELLRTDDFRPIAAWAMNDRMEGDELERQLLSFARLGYGGVMVLPWGGLPYSFMADEWLEGIQRILEVAKRENLEVWLWDDWLFPSGFGAGEVTENPVFRSKRLRIAIDLILESGETFRTQAPARMLQAAAVSVDRFGNPTSEFRTLELTGGDIQRTATGRERLIAVVWDDISSMTYTVQSHSRFLTDASEKECDIYTTCDRQAFSVDLLNPDATRQFLSLIHEQYAARFAEYFGTTLKGFFYDEPNIPSLFPWSAAFAEEFQKRKAYDIRTRLAPLLVEHRMNDWVFDLHPESVNQIRADYADVWTSLMAENFFGVIQRWCHSHGVESIGHLGSDETLASIVSTSGMYFKNMEKVDIPGVDVIFDQLPLGLFNDAVRMAGSRARLLGKSRAMSESFAGMGHAVSPDQMRYVMEYQIARGINKFINKLSNYNPLKSWYFHPPELSEANPLMGEFGKPLHDRTARLSALLSSGKSCEKIGIFIPAENYYRGDKKIAEAIESIARKLTYNQLEYEYLWDDDLKNLRVVDGKLDGFGCLLIPGGALASKAARDRLPLLDPARALVETPSHDSFCGIGTPVSSISDAALALMQSTRKLRLQPGDSPISCCSRLLEGRSIYFLLNESENELTVSPRWSQAENLTEVDLDSGRLYRMEPGADLKFQAGESRLFCLTTEALDVPQRHTSGAEWITLDGWTLSTPGGEEIYLDTELLSWDELGCGGYSGEMSYSTRLHFHAPQQGLVLRLGAVFSAAIVVLDGQEVGRIAFTPFRLDLPHLAAGDHLLEVRVMNTPANEIFGTAERYNELKREGAFKGTYAPIYEPIDRRKLRSGLLGPVRLKVQMAEDGW